MLKIILIVSVLICAVIILTKLSEYYARFDIEKTNFKEKWVKEAVRKYAIECEEKRYRHNGKFTRTKSGNYRKVFLKDVYNRTGNLLKLCFTDNYFNSEFKEYINNNFNNEAYKKNQLPEMIKKFEEYKEEQRKANLAKFVTLEKAITVKDFFEIYKKNKNDFVGCYVIHNIDKDLYYVGQSKRVMFRLNQHFTGHGNGDVYADYKYKNKFEIRVAVLATSGYSNIDLLERELIEKYNAYEKGYNRNAGNKY